jgi:hypothetical protein
MNGLNPMKTKILFAVCVVGLLLIHTAELRADTCVTNGKGYASMDRQPLQRIFDLMVSPRPGDEKILSETIRTFLSEGKIFTPKAGIRVEGYVGGPDGVLFVFPLGSSKGYYVLRECLSDCE